MTRLSKAFKLIRKHSGADYFNQVMHLLSAKDALRNGDPVACVEIMDKGLEGVEELSFYMFERFKELYDEANAELRRMTAEAFEWLGEQEEIAQ